MKAPSTMAVTKGDTHQRSVRKVRAEIAARADCIRPGWPTPDGGDDEVVVMTSIQVGATGQRGQFSVQWQPLPAPSPQVGGLRRSLHY